MTPTPQEANEPPSKVTCLHVDHGRQPHPCTEPDPDPTNKDSEHLDEILKKAGVPKGIHRIGFDKDVVGNIAPIDTLTEAVEALQAMLVEAEVKGYKKGHIDGQIEAMKGV